MATFTRQNRRKPMTDIINGPIVKGCFVRLRNGGICGPIIENLVVDWPWSFGDISWLKAGSWKDDGKPMPLDIVEVIPNPFTAAPEPSYEQKLWDEAALRMLGGLQPSAEAASKTADDFMAERAKRMKP
jgi:hypothetical protein